MTSLNQTNSTNTNGTWTEFCMPYYDQNRVYQPAQACPWGLYCCGDCGARKCCSDLILRIPDQSRCYTSQDMPSSTKTQIYMSISFESIIEICFLTIGLLVVTSFIYFKIRERVKRQNVLIAPIELMNSSSSSSTSVIHHYSMSSPPPYPSSVNNNINNDPGFNNNNNNNNASSRQNAVSTLSYPSTAAPPPAYSDLVKDSAKYFPATTPPNNNYPHKD